MLGALNGRVYKSNKCAATKRETPHQKACTVVDLAKAEVLGSLRQRQAEMRKLLTPARRRLVLPHIQGCATPQETAAPANACRTIIASPDAFK